MAAKGTWQGEAERRPGLWPWGFSGAPTGTSHSECTEGEVPVGRAAGRRSGAAALGGDQAAGPMPGLEAGQGDGGKDRAAQ